MAALSERMVGLGSARSEIREAFAFAQERAKIVGPENVDDFSIGNPSVPAPEIVAQTIRALVDTMDPVALHGYTPAAGDPAARTALAEDLNRRFGTHYGPEHFYLTAGAAAALSCVLGALCCPGDQVVTIAPYFPEYKVFVETAGAQLKAVPALADSFQPDLDALAQGITAETKAVIVNTPNNPTGVVYPPETLAKLGKLLEEKSAQYGHPVYLISDEPYREIVYTDGPISWLPSYYADTIVCYSYSKVLSLPGQRIGYALVPPAVTDAQRVYAGVCGAGRALGYVCAPSLFQFAVARCTGKTSDIAIYQNNRDVLVNALRDMGYQCAQPDGAFYLFVKALEPDAAAFCQRARAYDLILVSSDSFGCPGYVRVSYCVAPEQIRRALPKFRKLAEEYGVKG